MSNNERNFCAKMPNVHKHFIFGRYETQLNFLKMSSDSTVAPDSGVLADVDSSPDLELLPILIPKKKRSVYAAAPRRRNKSYCPYCKSKLDDDAQIKIPKGAAKKHRNVGSSQLSVLKLWRDICFEVSGKHGVLLRTDDRYKDARTLFDSKYKKKSE